MSENKEKGKSLSAQDLLSRLKKNKGEKKVEEKKKNSTYKDFISRRNKDKNTEEEVLPVVDTASFDSVYDEVYAAEEAAEAPVSLDAAAAEFFDGAALEDAAVNEPLESFGDFFVPETLEYPEELEYVNEAQTFSEKAAFVPEEAVVEEEYEVYSAPVEASVEEEKVEEYPDLTEDYAEYLPTVGEDYSHFDAYAAAFDEVPAEAYGSFEEPEFIAPAEVAVENEVAFEEVAEEVAYADEAEYVDEYAEYVPEIMELPEDATPEEIAAYADAGVPFEETVPEEDLYAATYSEMPVVPIDGEFYEDVIPSDDFFDNDPIDDFGTEEGYEYETLSEEEYTEEKDFEILVASVTGGAPVDEIDETDISLMVALGMEEELAKTVGEETATQLTDDYVADQEEWVDRSNRFGADEYSDFAQNEDIMNAHKKRAKMSFWKMLLVLVVSGILLFFENIALTGFQFDGALDPAKYPVVYIMADLQILLVIVFIMGTKVLKGLKDMISFKPSVDSLPALLVLAAVANSVVASFMVIPEAEPRMFNFGVAFCLLLAAVNEYMTARREMFSFSVISSDKPKYIMRRLSQRDSVLETEAVAKMDAPAADDGDIIKIQKTDFVDGYFWRTREQGTCARGVVGFALVISVILAVAVGVYAFIKKDVYPINVGFFALSAAIPATMMIVGFYPFYRANRKAFESDSTIIGEGSVEEYSGVGVISFDDVNVFPSYSVKVRNVRLFNNSRIDKVLYYASSVFSATGGPLADVFEVATMETGHSENVTILETGSGYIEAEVNGKSIMFGKANALAKHGILIPDDVIYENGDIPADCSVMYMIYQRKLVSKMIVNYVLDPDFEYVLKQLTGSGMCVCVKTFDPNIDEEMILRQLPQNNYALRVIKYKNTEEITKYAGRAEGGIVSRGDTKALLHTVASCDKILSAQKVGFAIGIISAILNAVLVAAILMSGQYNNILFSLYSVIAQIFWMLPVVITTKLIVR